MVALRAPPRRAARPRGEGHAQSGRRRAGARRGLRGVRARRLRGGGAHDGAVRRRHRALRRQPRAARRVGRDAGRRVDPLRRSGEGAARAGEAARAPSLAARGALARPRHMSFQSRGVSVTLSPAMWRRSILVALLLANVTLVPLAYASPPDQTWIGGGDDNADYDDVAIRITATVARVHAAPHVELR